VGFI